MSHIHQRPPLSSAASSAFSHGSSSAWAPRDTTSSKLKGGSKPTTTTTTEETFLRPSYTTSNDTYGGYTSPQSAAAAGSSLIIPKVCNNGAAASSSSSASSCLPPLSPSRRANHGSAVGSASNSGASGVRGIRGNTDSKANSTPRVSAGGGSSSQATTRLSTLQNRLAEAETKAAMLFAKDSANIGAKVVVDSSNTIGCCGTSPSLPQRGQQQQNGHQHNQHHHHHNQSNAALESELTIVRHLVQERVRQKQIQTDRRTELAKLNNAVDGTTGVSPQRR